MPRAAAALVSFNAGELSPLVHARVDMDRYAGGLALCRNFIPLVQGGLRNRPGSSYVALAKSSVVADRVRLLPFIYSQTQSYALEFGHHYFRVLKNRTPVLNVGVPVEIVTPWATADLPLLSVVQSADVLYVCHPDYPPYEIARLSDVSWTCTVLTFANGPFLDDDPGTVTLGCSGVTGSITLTASGAGYFTPDMATGAGSLFRIWASDIDIAGLTPWEPGKSITAGARSHQGGKIYLAATSGTTGTIPPTHEEGSRVDGVAGVKWTFESGFFGVVRITAVANANSATATVLQRLPQPLATKVSQRWAEGAWSDENGYPAVVTFFQDRLTFACSKFQPDTLWMSGVGDYPNFSTFNVSGQVTSDLAITVTMSSQQVNRIRGMVAEGAGLLVLTEAGEYLIAPANSGEGISQSNIRSMPQTTYGSAAMAPVRCGGATVFLQRAGRQLREIVYDDASARYVAPDLTVVADHMTTAGVAGMAFAQEPHAVLWVHLIDGALRGLTYDRDQQVTGWHRHDLGGVGDALGNAPFVESVAVIPSPDGSRADVWLAVRRYIDGTPRRVLEILNFDRDVTGSIADALFLDCSVTYRGAAASVISVPAVLNGAVCRVVADGSIHPNVTPAGGSVTLNRTATVVHIGFYAQAEAETLNIEAGAANGTAQAKLKRFTRANLRVYSSFGGLVGRRGGDVDRLIERAPGSPMDGPPLLKTGDCEITWPSGYETDGRLYVRQDLPLPFNLLGIFPIVQTQDG